MSDYRHGSHTTFSIHLHIVWITKYRHKVLRGEVAERVRAIVREELRIPVIPATQSSTKRFLSNFGDSGQLEQNRHEPVESGELENPRKSMERRSTFSLPAMPSPGLHQK